MIVCGFDPGLSAAGVALLNSVQLCVRSAATIRTSRACELEERFAFLSDRLRERLVDAELLAIEDQHGVFHALLRKGKSGPAAGRLERVVGMATEMARAQGIPHVMLSPGTIRSRLALAPKTKKAGLAQAVRIQTWGMPAGVSHHAVDAVAIALAGAREWHGRQVLGAGGERRVMR